MSKAELTHRQKTIGVMVFAAVMAVVVVVGLLLRQHGPGNMGLGLLQGAAVGLVGFGVAAWRVSRDRATTFERAWTQTGDERDDVLLTRSLAVLGLLAFPLTSVAAIAIGFGADVPMVLALLLAAQVAVLAITSRVLSSRS
jgi:hypothetical protein